MRQPDGRVSLARCRCLWRSFSRVCLGGNARRRCVRRSHCTARLRRRRSLFPLNFARRLVLAQTLERGLTNQLIRSPGRKTNLRHQRGLHPDRSLASFSRRVLKRRASLPQLLQLIAQRPMRFLREASARASAIHQPSIFVIAQQQRAHTVAAVRGFRKASDHELLFVHALHLQPVSAASRVIRAVGAF